MGIVLVIDDESAVREYLSALINRLGYSAETAATAADGLAKLAQPECRLVIADIFLPDSPPPETWIRQLARTAASRRVVLISGAPTQELSECATACGVGASRPIAAWCCRPPSA